MTLPRAPWATLALAGLALVVPLRTARAQVAVVVNRSSQVNEMKLEELRRLFLGEVTLVNRERVVLIEHPPSRKAFYRALLGMSEDQVKRHWIRMVFAGEGATPPREISDASEVKRFVAAHAGALAVLDAQLVDSTVKIVTVQGLRPADPSYPLRVTEAR